MYPSSSLEQNHLLASLPKVDFDRLSENLELIQLSCGEIIYKDAAREENVYFPTTALISLFCISAGGELPETVIIGSDGVLGMSQLLIGRVRISHAVVHSTGYAYRIKAQHMHMEYSRTLPLLRLLLGYARTLTALTQISRDIQSVGPSAFMMPGAHFFPPAASTDSGSAIIP